MQDNTPRSITKIIDATGDVNGGDCYTYRDACVNEIVITRYLSDLGVAPVIHDMALDMNNGTIIMERYHGTFTDLFFRLSNR